MLRPALCLLLASIVALPALGEDWVGFRGGQHFGVSSAKNLPTEWDDQQNIVWRQELLGPGTSSPILLAGRIYLTCYSGYAEEIENPGDQANLMRHVVCLDQRTGSPLWKKDFPSRAKESNYQGSLNTQHGYASSTIASDGERLYVFFGASGLYCLDLEGNPLWDAKLGSGTHGWGSATTPAVYQDLVIVNASIESESLIALNKLTGREVWRVSGVKSCWASPILVEAGGRTEVVLNVPNRLTSYDPASGDVLWHCDGCPDGYLCPSVIAHDGVVYVTGARKNTTLAVPAGGSGDVTEQVLWRKSKGSNVSSLVYQDGYLYWFHEKNGVVYCLDAKTGDLQYEKRLQPRPGIIYSSATLADGKIYATSQHEGTYVIEATPTDLNLLAVNQFASDETRTNASFAVADNRLFLRTDKAIYCIGKQ